MMLVRRVLLGAVVALLGPPTAAHAISYSLKTAAPGSTANAAAGPSVAVVGPYVAVGAPAVSKVFVYDHQSGALVRTLTNPNPTAGDDFGIAVAAHGNGRLLVGAPLEDNAGGTDAGAVYLFEISTGVSLNRFLKPTTPTANARFGSAVAEGFLDRVTIGADADDVDATDAGSVYLFSGTSPYTSLNRLKKATPAAGDRLGAVVLGGGTTVAAAPGDDTGATDAGAVYTFDTSFWNPGTLLLTIANPTPAVLDRFGVALTTVGVPGGTNLLVGTPYDDGAGTDAGAVYVFNLATGALLATIQRPGAVAGDLFGYALGSIGEAVIGAPLADVGATDSGAVYVFDNTSPYALLATINNPTAAAADNFGAAVASGCKLVATASGDDTLATNAGAAYLYERTMAACWTSGTGAQIGSWATAASWPAIAIHSTVLHTGNKGKVLFFQGSDPTSTTPTYTWDADLGTVAQQGNAEMDTFCAGHTTLSDGRAISVGGHAELTFANGIPVNDIFDPATGAWTRKADMAYSRWYPTATALGDGRVMVTSGWESGANPSNIPEVYDVGNNCWRSLSLNSVIHLANYPAMFLLPSGKLFQANGDANGGVNRMTRTLTVPAAGACADPANGTWTDVGLAPFNGLAGSAVLYQVSESGGVATAAKVLKSGGENPVLTSAATIDMMAGTPTWASTTAMNAARRNHNLTVLPDGKVLAIGGSSSNDGAEEIDGAVQGAEMWDPGTGAWTRMACISDPRMYHSTAVLLPDARVLSAGGNCFPSYQIYSPPYLFGGTRPTITSAPVDAVYNTSFNVGVSSPASAITSVVFIRPSSVTHAFDQNQRRVTAQFSVVDSTTLSVKAPLNNFVAPRGYYMMFVLANGVPSVARFVNLKDGGCP